MSYHLAFNGLRNGGGAFIYTNDYNTSVGTVAVNFSLGDPLFDCDSNGIADACDIASGVCDSDGNGVPDDGIGWDGAHSFDELREMIGDLRIGHLELGTGGGDAAGLAQLIDLHDPGHDRALRGLPDEAEGQSC